MVVELVAAGRNAFESCDWAGACKALSEADRDGGLAPEDLVRLADAHWWVGEPEKAEAALERAYAGYLEADNRVEASVTASRLAYIASGRLAMSVYSGWLSRAEKLADGQPESHAHAWLAMHRVFGALGGASDLRGAIRIADEALELAERTGSKDLGVVILSLKGAAMVYLGEWREGMALIDEAAVMAISEQKDLRSTSDVYCITISACSKLADYRRAYEWTDRADKWLSDRKIGGYPGICQVHRAELKAAQGAWDEAMEQALSACEILERFNLLVDVGFARYEIGEVKRKMGDLAGADEDFAAAYEHGHQAQPGMSLLMLDRGQVEEASAAIGAALDGIQPEADGGVSLPRGTLLSARVEIALAAGDTETAAAAADELAKIAAVFDSPVWQARALTWRGAVDLDGGDAGAASEALTQARRLWQEVGMPYENGRTRTLLARARLALGDRLGAGLEMKAARSIFSRLGARRDLRIVDELAVEAGLSPAPDRTRDTKAFMFTDIVASTDLIAVIGDDAWGNLRDWHDKSLRECIRHHNGVEVNHTGDGFFVAFDDPAQALDCAMEIQRRLAEHRMAHGFSPWVRIGLHLAEATRSGEDYTGVGVHTAARIGGLGGRDEIVVSTAVSDAIDDPSLTFSEPRTVSLKGVPEPVTVRTLEWR